jgi:hypothetical protein
MRAYDCNHDGTVIKLAGADDEELFENLKAHLAESHPELALSGNDIRGALTANGYEN